MVIIISFGADALPVGTAQVDAQYINHFPLRKKKKNIYILKHSYLSVLLP